MRKKIQAPRKQKKNQKNLRCDVPSAKLNLSRTQARPNRSAANDAGRLTWAAGSAKDMRYRMCQIRKLMKPRMRNRPMVNIMTMPTDVLNGTGTVQANIPTLVAL